MEVEEAPTAWTVVSHLEPRGALAVDFNVTSPTTCRLALFVHQATSGDSTTNHPGHADLWIDGESVAVPFMGTDGVSGIYHSRAKAGPIDTRFASSTALQAYLTAVYGEGSSFYSGIGFPEVEVGSGGRAVLSAMGDLVDNDQAVNLALPGSMLFSIGCQAAVTVQALEDADAIWTNAHELGGDTAVQAEIAGVQQGSMAFQGAVGPTELRVGWWGLTQGTITLSGASDEQFTLGTLPYPVGDVHEEQRLIAAGDLVLDWQTAEVYGTWYAMVAAWDAAQADIQAAETYPFP